MHSVNYFLSSQVIEGVDVLRELKTASRINPAGIGSDSQQTTESHVTSHVDFITSLAVMPYKKHQISQHFLISASHDGVIKLWK